jgi:hypothetical protein
MIPNHERRTTMPPTRILVATASLSLLLALMLADPVLAGEYQVASCQADRLHYSALAFNGGFVSRGMKIRSACNPEGTKGTVGVLTTNVRGRRRVPRGAAARVSIFAPPGTQFTTFKWAGEASRTDCRYSLQLFADNGPGVNTKSLKNYRANRRCSLRKLMQVTGY